MSILNYEEMTLESDTFQAARETFNLMMQKLFRKMEQSDMDEGSIDLKISIELNEDFVPQEDGTTVRIKKPLIKHKISTVVPVKDSADGKRDTGMWMRKRIQTFLAAVTRVQTIVVCHYHSARAKMITHTMTRWRNRDVQERKENA